MATFFRGVGAAALLTLPVLGTAAGSAGAAQVPVNLTGTVTCSYYGSLRFSPSMTNTLAPVTVSLGINLGSCSNSGAGTAITIAHGNLKATASAPASLSCGSLLSGATLPIMTGAIKWSTHNGKINPTLVTISHASSFVNLSGPNENFASVYLPTTIGSTGSFAGGTATVGSLLSDQAATIFTPSCGVGRPGLRGLSIGKSAGTVTGTITISTTSGGQG